jgi:ATP-dependent exoDNAse (exonuclease V) beta subunit
MYQQQSESPLRTVDNRLVSIEKTKHGRAYKIEGYKDLFPSVTTILDIISKPGLLRWTQNTAFGNMKKVLQAQSGATPIISQNWIRETMSDIKQRYDQEREQAAVLGTRAHKVIEDLLSGESPFIDQEMQPIFESFSQWRSSVDIEITDTEVVVYSPYYGYAGTIDAIGNTSNGQVVIDWKTGNALYPEHSFQVAAYARALSEIYDSPTPQAWVIRLGKRKIEVESRKIIDVDTPFQSFRAALYLWRSLYT